MTITTKKTRAPAREAKRARGTGREERKDLTPKLAKELLDGQLNIRQKSRRDIDKLCEVLRNGRFIDQGDTIKLDSEGRMRDGQTRCEAVVRTGITIPGQLFVRGIDNDIAIDTGRRRPAQINVKATFKLQSDTVSALAAGIARLVYFLDVPKTKSKPDSWDIVDTVERHRGILKVAHELAQGPSSPVPKITLGFVTYLASYADEDTAECFLYDVKGGEALPSHSPVLRLRSIMIDNRTRYRKLSRDMVIALTVKTWNAYVQERTLKVLRWSPAAEAFPMVEDADGKPVTAYCPEE